MRTAKIWSGVFTVNDDAEVFGVDADTREECERMLRAGVQEWRTANPGGTVEDAWMNTEASRAVGQIGRDYIPDGIVTRRRLNEFRAEIAAMVQALKGSDPVPGLANVESALVGAEASLSAVGGDFQ